MNSFAVTPRIIAVAGVDGSGKTTLTDWLRQELLARGHRPGFVWSRFNNYLSKPFLAATRVTGHNVYRIHEGVRMGFHEFGRLPVALRYLFVGLQALDVNIATLLKIRFPSRHIAVTICERGPWDTLVDVAADTGLEGLAGPFFAGIFCGQLAKRADVVLVERDAGLIECSRPELKFDGKLRQRQRLYRRLADVGGWKVIVNNGDLNDTKRDFSAWLNDRGY
ncbi:thymidylate kinase [Sulfuricaulis limicola]|uniref:Thymidylate kinase n=1 Tax=Sulfuricaulis limicola TaxID=1620215 RepID=A0A1B4XGG6_9GAMM|nr:hypothetical protein [Sulfuricaulis limicola]BAV33906.1 thymidylate kinase [Sulfuricaulis limicola]